MSPSPPTTTQTTTITATSSPGKVLLAGGYLVLDRQYTGLVFGLSARIHVLVEELLTGEGVELSEIAVRSPQFRGAVWNYGYAVEGRGGVGGVSVRELMGISPTLHPNPFVETTLTYALTYISTVLPPLTRISPAKITILADNDYYSQPTSIKPSISKPSQPSQTAPSTFTTYPYTLSAAHKTGLGSSAALVTSLTSSLLTHYLPSSHFSLSTPQGRSKLHNLAQAAHCAAQGKIGSGFDVAAAVYGTCVYRRFSPNVLSGLGEAGSAGFAGRVKAVVEDGDDGEGQSSAASKKKWDTEILKSAVTLPKGYTLLMCDVDCGSQTVSMVKKVLEWRSRDPADAKKIWNSLQEWNEKLAGLLSSSSANDAVNEEGISTTIEHIRTLIREMGTKAHVPIEPPEQTALLDMLTREVDGVLGGVVPGAGGYDAIVLLVREEKNVIRDVEGALERWKKEGKGNVRLLGVRGEVEGARREGWDRYREWIG